MSTVSGSSSGSSDRPNDVVRRNREEYLQKESDLVKRHQRELRRLAESHQQEIDTLRTEHDAQLDNLKDRSRENISSRDMKYQKDMDDMRALYRKQLQQVAQDSDRDKELRKENATNEIKTANQRGDERVGDLEKHYNSVLRDQEKAHQDSLNEVKERQAQAIQNQREIMNKQHDEALKTVDTDRTSHELEAQRKFRDYRLETDQRIKNQELQAMKDKERLSDSFTKDLQNERASQQQEAAQLREGFKGDVDNIREKYNHELSERSAQNDQFTKNFKDDASSRISGRIGTLEKELNDQKELQNRSQVNAERVKNREVADVRDQFQKNIDNLEQQKQQLVRDYNARSAKEISGVNSQNADLVRTTNQFYRDRLESQELKNREAYASLQTDSSARTDQAKNQADLRVQRVIADTNDTTQKLTNNQRDQVDMIKQQHADDLKDLRLATLKDKSDTVETLKTQMRNNEVKHAEQTNQLVVTYEKRISDLTEQMQRDKKLADENTKRLVNEMKKSHEADIALLNAQNQEKLRQVDEQHTRELKAANQRNQEKLDHLITASRRTETNNAT
jgi:hypothetical protein